MPSEVSLEYRFIRSEQRHLCWDDTVDENINKLQKVSAIIGNIKHKMDRFWTQSKTVSKRRKYENRTI